LTIDMFGDDEFLAGEPTFIGRSCAAGRRFVRLNPDGEVFRRSEKRHLCNLLAGTFIPTAQASECDTSYSFYYCFYFCRKYSSNEAQTISPPAGSGPRETSGLARSILTNLRSLPLRRRATPEA
jgi:hypothetical protein